MNDRVFSGSLSEAGDAILTCKPIAQSGLITKTYELCLEKECLAVIGFPTYGKPMSLDSKDGKWVFDRGSRNDFDIKEFDSGKKVGSFEYNMGWFSNQGVLQCIDDSVYYWIPKGFISKNSELRTSNKEVKAKYSRVGPYVDIRVFNVVPRLSWIVVVGWYCSMQYHRSGLLD